MTPERGGKVNVITLRAMKFDALIGILPHESEFPQPVEVDLSLTVQAPTGSLDAHTILDYRHAYQLVSDTFGAGHIDYLEEAADRIATAALALPLVRDCSVAIRKMEVALPGPLAYAEVKVERSRE